MLEERYLHAGITGLSRAGDQDPNNGHFGAAVIAAYYFCAENQLSQVVQQQIAKQLDQMIAKYSDLFVPFTKENSQLELIKKVENAIDSNIETLHAIGHNVIFASLALKALKQTPQMITPSISDGIARLLYAFSSQGPGGPFYGWEDISKVTVKANDNIPIYTDEQIMIDFVFEEFAKFPKIYKGRHQGVVGHLLTHAHALIELSRMGYPQLAAKGHNAHRLYIKLARNLPDAGELLLKEHQKPSNPLELEYWERDLEGELSWLFGHAFKFPYGFYSLIKNVDNQSKVNRYCRQLGYLLSVT